MQLPEKKYAFILLFIAFVIASPNIAHSQISLTTENMALGGGGTAYLTGFESLFVNPANLYIQEKNYRFQISMLYGGFYYDTLLPVRNNIDRFKNFADNSGLYNRQTSLKELNGDDYETLLNRNYHGRNTTREFLTEADFYWFGLKWVRPERSYAVSFRTRYASRYTLGKGLFTNIPIEKNGLILDKSFNQKIQSFHELSFGYAESFTFLNGLLPQLSEFIIGIAPKIVLAGASLEADYTNIYKRESDTSEWTQNLDYKQQSSGSLSQHAQGFFNTETPTTAPSHLTFKDLIRPAGFGIGLDIGITYLITLGDDLSVFRQQNEPTEKSLRLSLSITDLGAVYQSKSPVEYASEFEVNVRSDTDLISETVFMGSPNNHYAFLSQFNDFSRLTNYTDNSESFELLLPTSIQTGILFQYQRLKVVGDFSYSLAKSPFNHSGLASYIGIELRPLPYIPIRGGTRFAKDLAGYYSFGTGVETKWFDLNMSVQLKSRRIGPTTEITGMSILGAKFYLQ